MPQPKPASADPNTLPQSATAAGQVAVCVHPRAAWRNVGGEVFVITGDRAFHRLAAPTAVDLLKRLALAPATVGELADQLVRDYQVDTATAQRDVTAFVEALIAKQIAAPTETAADPR